MRVRFDPALGCDLEAWVEHGDIVVEGLGFTGVVEDERSFTGRLGEGGRRLSISSEHGDVYLSPLDP